MYRKWLATRFVLPTRKYDKIKIHEAVQQLQCTTSSQTKSKQDNRPLLRDKGKWQQQPNSSSELSLIYRMKMEAFVLLEKIHETLQKSRCIEAILLCVTNILKECALLKHKQKMLQHQTRTWTLVDIYRIKMEAFQLTRNIYCTKIAMQCKFHAETDVIMDNDKTCYACQCKDTINHLVKITHPPAIIETNFVVEKMWFAM